MTPWKKSFYQVPERKPSRSFPGTEGRGHGGVVDEGQREMGHRTHDLTDHALPTRLHIAFGTRWGAGQDVCTYAKIGESCH